MFKVVPSCNNVCKGPDVCLRPGEEGGVVIFKGFEDQSMVEAVRVSRAL